MHKVFARTTWSALLAAAISLVFTTTGLTHGDWPDGPHKEWFQNLQRPDNDAHPSRKLDHKSLFCCGAADIVKTKFTVELAGGQHPDDVWYAWVNDAWTRTPPEKIVKDYAPDDQAHLFMLGGHDPVLRAAQGWHLITGLRAAANPLPPDRFSAGDPQRHLPDAYP